LGDLVDLLNELQARDIDIYLHQQAIDTSTPSGRMLFGMLSVFSEFERAMIRDRVRVRRLWQGGLNERQQLPPEIGHPIAVSRSFSIVAGSWHRCSALGFRDRAWSVVGDRQHLSKPPKPRGGQHHGWF
jgi:hypothetical protein